MPITVVIPAEDRWDNKLKKFVTLDKEYELTLEHSLLSISKWEQKWHKPFLDEHTNKSYEETCDYIRCMTITQHIPPEVYHHIPDAVINEVDAYIHDPATATWISNNSKGAKSGGMAGHSSVLTNEIVYYWMIELGIPEAYQKWHFNHLMTLIQVINVKRGESDPKNKMSRSEVLAQQARINKERRAAMKARKK